MISAPSASIAKPRSTAAAVASVSPPSEKLSGVTLTMPISRTRSSDSPANWRPAGAALTAAAPGPEGIGATPG